MNRANAVAGLVCVAFAVYVYLLSGTVPEGAALDPLGGRFLPRVLAVALALFGAALAATGFLGVQVKGGQATLARPKAEAAPTEEGMEARAPATGTDPEESATAVLAYIAVMGAYVWLLPVTGFLLTSLVVFSVFIYLLGQRNVLRAVVVSAVLTGGLYGLFGVVFGVRLPAGILF